ALDRRDRALEPTAPDDHAAVSDPGPTSSSGPAPPVAATLGQATIKVDMCKLDGFVDLVGELAIVQSMIHQDLHVLERTDVHLSRNLAQLQRIVSELRRNAMAMRLVPIRQTFQRMRRLVRDLSQKSGKALELTVS